MHNNAAASEIRLALATGSCILCLLVSKHNPPDACHVFVLYVYTGAVAVNLFITRLHIKSKYMWC